MTLPFFGRDRFLLVFEHGEQLFVRGPVGVLPEALRGRGFQHLFGAVAGDLAQPARHRPGELLGFAGQDVFQFLFDVDVRVELVDQVVADRGADLLVLDQRPLVLTQSSVFSAWRSIQIAKTLRKASTEPSTTRALTVRRRPRLIDGDAIREPMKLEGIHHITAITADAQSNVDFYAGVLGLRLVKKTVNQDNPTVYHLFFADEKGSAGSDLTFFEFPGVPPGRAGAGDVHRIVWRVGSARRSTSGRSGSAPTGSSRERAGESLRFSDPRASTTSWSWSRSPTSR